MRAHRPAPWKHHQIFSALRHEIQSGKWKQGERLPSESELGARFGVSRITVVRAVRDLQQAGMVHRRAGAGTFVKGAAGQDALSFGLLIPDLGETEIFEAICHGMMASPLARRHALVWGAMVHGDVSRDDRAWHLCRQYIDRRVSGVFFAPSEEAFGTNDTSIRIAREFDRARIPVVLLDRPLRSFPQLDHYDVVGIDNWRAGHIVTTHLLRQRCRRVAFIAQPHAVATLDAREAGYREALWRAGRAFEPALAERIAADDAMAVKTMMDRHHPDGIVCANDRTAALLMPTLLRLGHRIPEDVRLIGIDDAEYARLLPVPLTTLQQPTHQIGEVALSVMLERFQHRELPPRQVLLKCELVIRESCGARTGRSVRAAAGLPAETADDGLAPD